LSIILYGKIGRSMRSSQRKDRPGRGPGAAYLLALGGDWGMDWASVSVTPEVS
jgi:hypothetical protein